MGLILEEWNQNCSKFRSQGAKCVSPVSRQLMGDQRIRTVTCLPIFIFATFDNWTNPCPTILIDMIDAVSRETTFGGKPSIDLKTNLSRNESLTLTEIVLKGFAVVVKRTLFALNMALLVLNASPGPWPTTHGVPRLQQPMGRTWLTQIWSPFITRSQSLVIT